ncbi:N-acetylmuramoyl-L-alanine amidase family protein [Candidatus Acidulodesulfobacterium sp. H_13]|uniref:N-acetylmuramoyl-L-alanine amidase family protein n=1 Tax=Candidatus Acidulodesulfobacterium sp. H_13 TaxID=3395470 RepID=UPI003AF436B4
MKSPFGYKRKVSFALLFLPAFLFILNLTVILMGIKTAYAYSGNVTKITRILFGRSSGTINVYTIGSPFYKEYLFKKGYKRFSILVFGHAVLYGSKKKIVRPFKNVFSVSYSQFSTTPEYAVHIVIRQKNISAKLRIRTINLGNDHYKVVIYAGMVSSKVKKEPEVRFNVFIDAGHGGNDPGGIGPMGLPESFVNLSIALKLKKILEARGIKTEIDRTSNINVSLQQRAAEANRSGADLFIGLYSNSAVVPYMYGTTTYYYHYGNSHRFAKYLEHYISSRLNLKYDGVVHDDLYVLRFTKMPAVIIEYAYISNPYEEHLLASSTFRQLIANGIANAIYKYYIIKKR